MPGFVPASFPAVGPLEPIVKTSPPVGRIIHPPETPAAKRAESRTERFSGTAAARPLPGPAAAHQEVTGHDMTGHEMRGHEMTGYEMTGYEMTGYEMTGHEATGRETTGREVTGQELAILA